MESVEAELTNYSDTPRWARYAAILCSAMFIGWRWLTPGVVAILTGHYRGVAEFRKGAPVIELAGREAMWLGCKMTMAGVLVIGALCFLERRIFYEDYE